MKLGQSPDGLVAKRYCETHISRFFVRVIKGERYAYFKDYKGPFFERANVVKIQFPLETITFNKCVCVTRNIYRIFEYLSERRKKSL